MIAIGIFGFIVTTIALIVSLAFTGIMWIVFWVVIFALVIFGVSDSYGLVVLYVLFVALNLLLIYKIIRRKK
ncbi:hypothetical protein BA918_07685 [Helicobacter pullorum]|uniref:hypothetical protein n=1 Tax=Helicobacter pullorum TaxID=35818 RepID=UPI0008168EE3|nr:hypothetical protein [Helicobacter pullorum]OCR18380.1 hypothetical protein BA918_07685 [Helicobacter pullorum]